MTKLALKDYEKIKNTPLKKQVKKLFEIIEKDPFTNPPPFERLRGNFEGLYSRRINIQHRLVYKVEDDRVVVLSMWSHYEGL